MTSIIKASIEDRYTLEQFSKLIEERRKYLHETTEQSVAACAINMLKSIRAATKVANPNDIAHLEVKVQDGLYHSYYKVGQRLVPCLRIVGSKTRYPLGNGVMFAVADQSVKPRFNKIWLWVSKNGTKYYIAASAEKSARQWIKNKEKKRIKKYAGLAKLALGLIMHKVSESGSTESGGPDMIQVALKTARVEKSVTGNFNSGIYSLTLDDQLNYALDALKGGPAELNICIKKSMNKIVGIMNQKCKDMLGFNKMESPFPEVKGKR